MAAAAAPWREKRNGGSNKYQQQHAGAHSGNYQHIFNVSRSKASKSV